MDKKSGDNDLDAKGAENGRDPTAPITRKGVLTSLLTGKPMEIPELDIVSFKKLHYLFKILIYFSFSKKIFNYTF